ncbi:hypothetical protein [Gloeobacter kilaueensis]|uniref:Uncharacterized protein n=1 Tax=Gloeobacter kilaueensis (strain ATCC BAA-2537 / CCAP 1431/1 / ULC 316 / JS1) TaxID=1183438 RepID=U5QCI3_GLOK1|nr:hypothetical protein [Gloeobacter kilaueensis]AGY56627.1 hypothetical protein GKIL_0380 [Gloeobacter kilaueensis JS1]
MHFSATQKLQFELRSRRDGGESIALPAKARWREGTLLWSEIVYYTGEQAEALRSAAERVHLLDALPPAVGLLITPEFEAHGRQLALDIDQQGYGGLVRFEDLVSEDTYLQVVLGEGLFPLIVREEELKHFWTELTLRCERHFLAVASQHGCFGYWESDLAISRSTGER